MQIFQWKLQVAVRQRPWRQIANSPFFIHSIDRLIVKLILCIHNAYQTLRSVQPPGRWYNKWLKNLISTYNTVAVLDRLFRWIAVNLQKLCKMQEESHHGKISCFELIRSYDYLQGNYMKQSYRVLGLFKLTNARDHFLGSLALQRIALFL